MWQIGERRLFGPNGLRVGRSAAKTIHGRRGARCSATLAPELAQRVDQWLRDSSNQAHNARIEQLHRDGDVATLEQLLGARLTFGTAGLRALDGPGYARMNEVTVQQATAGLLAYLEASAEPGEVGIDREDGAAGGDLCAQDLRCAAGIVITASHNPASYNGYKVYLGDGCQIRPRQDTHIEACITEAAAAGTPPVNADWDALWCNEHVHDATPAWDRYLQSLQRLSKRVSVSKNDIIGHSLQELCVSRDWEECASSAAPVVYTPLHGVGWAYVQAAFAHATGLPSPVVVPEQAEPDASFRTTPFPNPEEGQGVWDLAHRTDADRMAVSEAVGGDGGCGTAARWRNLTGNEIGALLADWLWSQKYKHESRPVVMLNTVVSSKLLLAMGANEGFGVEQTLTGFKWLGARALELTAGDGACVPFAYEEAIGFAIGERVRDKDGIAAALVFAEMAAHHRHAHGRSCCEHLGALYDVHGYFAYRSGYVTSDDPALMRRIFEAIREGEGGQPYCTELAGLQVTAVRDLGSGLDTAQPDRKARLHWAPGDLFLTFDLQGGAWLTLRASGTEPKLKFYLEVPEDVSLRVDSSRADTHVADAKALELERACMAQLLQPEAYGLRAGG